MAFHLDSSRGRRVTWVTWGWTEEEGGERTRHEAVERNSPMAFSCSAFVWCYLASPCYSNHTMRYKAADCCSCFVPPLLILLLPPLYYKSLKPGLADWSWGRWNIPPFFFCRTFVVHCPCCLGSLVKRPISYQNDSKAVDQLDLVSSLHICSLSLSLTSLALCCQFCSSLLSWKTCFKV